MKRSDRDDDVKEGIDIHNPIHDEATGEVEHDDTIESSVFSVAAHDPDQWPDRIFHGSDAKLSAVRDTNTYSTFFIGPRALLPPDQIGISCRVQWRGEDSLIGKIFITVSQILFVSSTETENTVSDSTTSETKTTPEDHDWAIGATCIHLHAMAEEPQQSIYLQLSEEGGDDDDSTLEVTLIPLDHQDCQILFDGLCKLVARHPLQLDDDDDGPGFGGPGGFFMAAGDAGGDDMIWAPSAGVGSLIPEDDDDEEGGATEDERMAMLARLDNMLIVQPDMEVHDGQFDDADEDDDDDDVKDVSLGRQ